MKDENFEKMLRFVLQEEGGYDVSEITGIKE